MVTVSDILKLLDQVPIWKTVKALPGRVQELERRVAALEEGRAAPAKPEHLCLACGGTSTFKGMMNHPTFGRLGIKQMKCDDCGLDWDKDYNPREAGKGA